MSNVTESIYSDKTFTIPMAEVSHLVDEDLGTWVIFKHSKTNPQSKLKMKLEPSVWLGDGKHFRIAYNRYRHELDGVNL